MPYIHQPPRDVLDKYIIPLARAIQGESMFRGLPGLLNYTFFRIITLVFGFKKHSDLRKMVATRHFHYRAINDAIGALHCCAAELYRRVAAPYEDRKIIENGDIGASD